MVDVRSNGERILVVIALTCVLSGACVFPFSRNQAASARVNQQVVQKYRTIASSLRMVFLLTT